MTSSASKARPAIMVPCTVSMQTETSPTTTKMRNGPRNRSESTGSRTPSGISRATLPPISSRAARTLGWSRYSRSVSPGWVLSWTYLPAPGSGRNVRRVITNAKAATPARPTRIHRPRISRLLSDLERLPVLSRRLTEVDGMHAFRVGSGRTVRRDGVKPRAAGDFHWAAHRSHPRDRGTRPRARRGGSDERLVGEAPAPVLARLEGTDDGVVLGARVRACVTVRRGVAAADVP